jgi:heat shock protein HtpX
MRVNGLHGHIQRNRALSLACFVTFLLLFELLGLCAAVAFDLASDARTGLRLIDEVETVVASAGSTGFWLIPLSIGLSWLFFGWRHYESLLRKRLRAEPLAFREAPRLHRLVETLAIAAGIPAPKICVIAIKSRNAFALGFSPSDASIFVTRGLLENLNAGEIEAALAHEIRHIAHGDTRLLASAALCCGAVLQCVGLASLFLRASPVALLALVAAAFTCFRALVMIGLAVLFALAWALAARAAISRAREFLADARAVELTKNPDALISALRKMSGRDRVPGLDSFSQAMLISPADDPFALQPRIEARIAALMRRAPAMIERAPESAEPSVPWTGPDAFPGGWREALRALQPPAWTSSHKVLGPVILGNLAFIALIALASGRMEAERTWIASHWGKAPASSAFSVKAF